LLDLNPGNRLANRFAQPGRQLRATPELSSDRMPFMTRLRRYRPDVVQSPLETYLREINETALLTADEEKDLARRIAAQDHEARDQMVRANLRLVVNIARGYTGKGLALQDLIEEGNLGLLRAVEGFDPNMNTRFSTYASYWIKQSIKRALVNTAKTIRIPAYMVELLAKWRRATNKLTDELGRPPTHEEVARYMGLPRKKLNIIKKAIRVYNAAPQTDQGEQGWSIDEMLMDSRSKTPDCEMVETDDLKHVMVLLDKMDKREATVLRMRFGLDDDEPRTLKEIGECLGLTRERVRQIESEALAKLSESLNGE
jgi:RNA polymerase primary sigma factor